MKLNNKGIEEQILWEEKNYVLPNYNREEMVENTKNNPTWVHFGGGNIFRAFHCRIAQSLLNQGKINSGITVIEGYDREIVDKCYKPFDNLSILITLKETGEVDKEVIGSVAESYGLDCNNAEEFEILKDIFAKDSLQMATFTITEKGYQVSENETDFYKGPYKTTSYMGNIATLMYHRYINGEKPIAMVSTDNCSHNGDKLYMAIRNFAVNWVENNLVENGFIDYIMDETKVSFPWTMIDKITPRPDMQVREMLKAEGIEGVEPIVTSKNTYIAPFVNGEETEYLVVEDAFPNGRPDLESAGVILTDKETVDKVERMKVCTCLNPLHTTLAVFGCILGHTSISQEMKDKDLVKLVERLGYEEGLPVVTDPKVLNPKEFIDTVLNNRLPNPFIPDTPQRIATDTSQKLSIRFGETIKNYVKAGRSLETLKVIPLVFAGWLRYLMGVNDEGKAFELSSDPMISKVQPLVLNYKNPEDLEEVLSDAKIFGVNLYEAGMAEEVVDLFEEMKSGKGKVRTIIQSI